MDDYDVFLNHSGPDVKGAFVAHLYNALQSVGLNPFLDKKSLIKGSPTFTSIDDALEVAKVHVAVVSKGYADSKYCLSELVAMLRSGKPVIPVFYDVEPAKLRRVEKGHFAAAFQKHKSRETTEQVQEWTDALRKLVDITGFVFRLSDYHGDEAELKQEVVDAILSLLPSKEPLQVESHLFGIKEQIKICINKLEKKSSTTNLLGLVGMGGIGKTTLAKEIYNHLIGQNKFQAMSILEIDRLKPSNLEIRPSLLNKLQKKLLWDLLYIPESNQQFSYKYWFNKLPSRGPILIVLDDIQDKGQFDKLILNTNLLAPGSCIIITSRDQHLLKLIGGKSNFYLHEVTPLKCQDSQKLFNWHAFGDDKASSNFEALANDVSNACGGLPLALKVVGSSLFDKTSNEDRSHIWPEAIDALKGNSDVMNALKWSYDCLSESEKLMFVDIACVFCGWKKQEALDIWQSCKECSSCCRNGTPHTSLTHLIDKSLVTILKYSTETYVLAMHGLLQDMGQGIGEVEGSHLWKKKAVKVIEDNNQNSSKVRAMNLTNSGKYSFDVENFTKMQNLHFLILDGCHVRGKFGSISKELRYLQWRYMPLSHIPIMLNLSNLISLDLSRSTKLANTWTESEPALEGCPNLLRLNLSECTSITTLPDSIGHLSRLQVLDLNGCENLQKLPNSIGQLTSLEELTLGWCESLEGLPDSIIALSGLQRLAMIACSSISKLPATFGLIGLTHLNINLVTEWQAVGIGQLNALEKLGVVNCTDEVISMLDSSGAFRNLHQLSSVQFYDCPSMTKLPETIGLLTNLDYLELWRCEKMQDLPNSIGQLKLLKTLTVRKCSSLKTLPDSLGALKNLQDSYIVENASMTKLPTSIGHLSSLRVLVIQECGELRSLPDSLRQLNALEVLLILDCGSSLEGLGLMRALQGLRIWGCTSITELPGSCLAVVDSNFSSPAWFWDYQEWIPVLRKVKEVRVVEANDCGYLCQVQDDTESGRAILQRVHNSPCIKSRGGRIMAKSGVLLPTLPSRASAEGSRRLGIASILPPLDQY